MRRMALSAALAAAVSLAIAVAVGVGGASGSAALTKADDHADGHHGQRILGTWLVNVMTVGQEPFQAMINFSPGGGLVETESIDPGTALGSWKSLGHGRVAFSFQRFEFDAEGAPDGRVVVRSEVTVRHKEFSGPFEFEVFDAQGNVVFSGEGTATATRYPVEPL